MMLNEFVERTGFEPMPDEYREIEEAYYEFDGDKDAFCLNWKHTVGVEGMCKIRGQKIEQLHSAQLEINKDTRKELDKLHQRITKLEADLEREQEWQPFESEHNVKQADYERLAADQTTRELTDDEAADIIADEFGFDRSKIKIVHEVSKTEINRHRQVRKTGTYQRKALFNAWDWNYIVFNVKCNVTMGYEMHNGQLQMY